MPPKAEKTDEKLSLGEQIKRAWRGPNGELGAMHLRMVRNVGIFVGSVLAIRFLSHRLVLISPEHVPSPGLGQ